MSEEHEQKHQRHEEMHRRPGQGNRHPPRITLGPVCLRFIPLGHLVEVVHADDPHVGPGGDGLQAVLGVASLKRPDAGPEADEELGDLHAGPLGREVMAELVHEDHEDQRQDDDHPAQTGGEAESDDQADQTDRSGPALLDDLAGRVGPRRFSVVGPFLGQLIGVGHTVTLSSMTRRVASRATRSHSMTTSTSVAPFQAIGRDWRENVGNVDPADVAVQESGDHHLVGRVQPSRSGLAGSTGIEGQVEAPKCSPVGRLEVEPLQIGPVDGPNCRVSRSG